MYDLIIDIGNSYHKWAIFSKNGDLIHCERNEKLTKDILEVILSQYDISHAICSSVGDFDPQCMKYLQQKTKYVPFSHNTPIPIKLQYATPNTLGLDRIANAVGAFSLFPHQDVLSIQMGTCIVFDFVNSHGNYLGGSISPGMEMRFKSLNHYTQNLPLITQRPIDFFIGDSTQHSIESGVIHGIIDEINSSIQRYSEISNHLKILLTGGDASYFHNSIKNAIFAPSNLVLIGLHKILKLNVQNG